MNSNIADGGAKSNNSRELLASLASEAFEALEAVEAVWVKGYNE